MKEYFLVVILGLLLFGCADEPKLSEAAEVELLNELEEIKPYRFECFKRDTNPNRFGLFTLFFRFTDNKIAIDNIPVCGTIQKKQWDEIGIPAHAIDAKGGKWASGAAYFYAERDSTDFIIFKISADELDGEPGAAEEVYRVKGAKIDI